MAADIQLTKDWIQYLKNNQIIAMKSDPTTGRLNYRRPVTADDLRTFLISQGTFDDTAILSAINAVLQPSKSSLPATIDNAAPPDQESPSTRKKYSNADATDVEPRYGPRAQIGKEPDKLPAPQSALPTTKPHGGKKPGETSQSASAVRKRATRADQAKTRKSGSLAFDRLASDLSNRTIKESFADTVGQELSERDVEQVFDTLTAKVAPEKTKPTFSSNPEKMKQDELNKLRRVIRDTMTDRQRLALWRALTNA